MTAILSGYRPTEEQLRSLEAAVKDLRAKVEALEVKTSEITAAIATLELSVDQHDTKHREADEKLKIIAGMQQDNDRGVPDFQLQTSNHVDVIKAQGKRIDALEGEVDILKKQSVKDQKEIAALKEDVVNLKGTVAALLTQ